jgi:hypothetical protein
MDINEVNFLNKMQNSIIGIDGMWYDRDEFELHPGATVPTRKQKAVAAMCATLIDSDVDKLRSIIREEVHKALHEDHSDGVVDPRQFQRIEITDTDGKRYRGLVYLVEEEPGL